VTATAHTVDGFERARAADLAPGELRAAKLSDGTTVCVGNADGAFFAVCDECPHAGFPLSEGSLLEDGVLECAWHGTRFDCRTGVALREAAFEPLVRYDVRVADGGVWVRRGAAAA
jgi:3-phenylpropionate/trans-cinnamate dioxygenase ferredoxin subunit